tara:strand:+ start:812 stop:1297 length:486 start_codon:yes stop_codon:yes gene_type:complete
VSWQLGRWYLLALFIIVIDQLTKFWVTQMFAYGETFELLPILNMTLVHNTGAAFSFLSDAGGWQRWFFVIISMVVSTILAVWLYRLPSRQYLLAMAITLILGGALGNLCDRILLGYVVDFVDAHYQQHHWPAFNVADATITLGAVLLILESLLAPKQRKMD